jgi:hypothetical protein
VVEAGDAVAALINVSALDINAGKTDTVGSAGLTGDGTLLADDSVDIETVSAGASVVEVESGSGGAGGALSGVCGIADGAVKSSAGIALESLGGIQIEARETSTSAVVGVVEETSTSIAGNASGRSEDDIETSGGGAGSGAAASRRIIGLGVLRNDEVGVKVLIKKNVSGIGDSYDDVGNSRLNIESLHDWGDKVSVNDIGSVNVLVEDESINSELHSVVDTKLHSYGSSRRNSSSDWLKRVSIAELELDGSTHGKTSEGNFSAEKNSVIVSVLGSVVLQEEDVGVTGWASEDGADGNSSRSKKSVNSGSIQGQARVFLDELLQTLGRNGEEALLSDSDDVGEGGSDEGVSGGAEEVIADGEDVS